MVDVSMIRGQESPVREIPTCWLDFGATERVGDEQDSWRSYWEQLTENQQLFREQSDEYFRNLCATFGLDPRMRVLDFGCGFGHVAELLAPHVGELSVWDSSANMRRRARVNLAERQNIRFLDLFVSNPSGSDLQFDVILVNSVIQYMSREEFFGSLLHWKNMLAPRGRIVISDIIPPDYPSLRDVWDLLRFSARRGFLLRATWQALGEIWRYWGVRQVRPLTRFGREDLNRQAAAAGLAVSYPHNLTHFKKRITAVFMQVGVE